MIECVEDVRAFLEKECKRLSDELLMREDPRTARLAEATLAVEREERVAQTLKMERRFLDLRRTKDQLAEVEHALDKIAKGTYGLCDSCGETIPAARLEIFPQTGFCAGCKAKRR
jgi:DnaK suppressor protein